MAGLKKPVKKRDTTNPNTALVLFLVFFVLLSIGLGVWGYFGYSGQEKLRQETAAEKKSTAAARLGEEYANFIAWDTRTALGHPLAENEPNSYKAAMDAKVIEDGGKFKDEKTRAAIKKMIDDNRAELGWDGAKYTTTYRDLVKKLKGDLGKSEAALNTANKGLDSEKKRNAAIEALYKTNYEKNKTAIETGNAETLKAAQAKTAEFESLRTKFVEIQKELENKDKEFAKEKEKLIGEQKVLMAELNKTKKAALEASQSVIGVRKEPHALFLDVSTGKALWDDPLGKITLVDNKARLVTINIGSAMRVKPELAFNVFASGWKKRGEGIIKGTIEVVRILGPNASVARITSLYDAEGKEIILADNARGRILREADNPLKEGDLIFNMAFGSRVVVAGNINWLELPAETPAEQMRNLKDFFHILGRQGVKVDAYLDVTDAKLQGEITNKTRFLILGKGMFVDPKSPLADQAKKINAAIAAVRAEAVERGMFVISADNFANVIGYRRPRSANDTEPSAHNFRPGLPAGGSLAP
jgi:hypothetical protein